MPVLRATFVNKLEYLRDENTGPDKVFYKHSYRCAVKAWFEATDSNPYGWILQFQSQNSNVLKQFRSDIFRDAVSYVERRARRRATEINFESIVDLANAMEIKSSESSERKSQKERDR